MKKVRDFSVFIDTAFDQVACIGTAEQYDNLSFVFNLVALPQETKKIMLVPTQPTTPVQLTLAIDNTK